MWYMAYTSNAKTSKRKTNVLFDRDGARSSYGQKLEVNRLIFFFYLFFFLELRGGYYTSNCDFKSHINFGRT